MKRRLFALVATAGLLGSILATVAAPTAFAITCHAGTVTYYDGGSATGAHISLCADEYPAASESCSLDQPYCKFDNGTAPDNRISSIYFGNAAVGTSIRVCTGYYFGGTCGTFTRPSASPWIVNLSPTFNNSVSSFYSCGQDGCGDER